MTETVFKIDVPDASLHVLRQRLDLTVLPDELDEAGWDYGVPLSDIRRLVAHWKDGYDWRKYEAQLNAEMPQFTRNLDIDGFGALNIHYIHQKSKVADAIPLLFVHGWPGSFLEVRKILPLLVEGSAEYPAFHVVAFSLPGYGFSEGPKRKGFGLDQYAEVGNKLMLALGYNEYVTQGGDWGYIITRRMAQVYGHKHSKAWHSNVALASPPHPTRRPLLMISHLLFRYSPAEKAGLERSKQFQEKGLGYMHEQATMPQTIGYSLADSPVGLLAWIYEKLVGWADNNYHWDDDEVLTWISIYWFSRAGPTASLRIYREALGDFNSTFTTNVVTTIPRGFSSFPKDNIVLPKRWVKTPNLVFYAEHDGGGHFAAYERPKELVGDLRKMFGRGGPAFGVVPGKTGYANAQARAKL